MENVIISIFVVYLIVDIIFYERKITKIEHRIPDYFLLILKVLIGIIILLKIWKN